MNAVWFYAAGIIVVVVLLIAVGRTIYRTLQGASKAGFDQ